jgi:SAM-dependent methyltransferase
MEIPLPPVELRSLIGRPNAEDFVQPEYLFDLVNPSALDCVLDFGCGCGRLARHLMLATSQPRHYEGLDLHAGMIQWCQENLSTRARQFFFSHHDVHNLGLNPGVGKPAHLSLDFPDGFFSLIYAWSVFTHLLEADALFYLQEMRRVLRPNGQIVATWFFFDKHSFPMMQHFQNALYMNAIDPTNAVIFDQHWFRVQVHQLGLKVVQAIPPEIRGFHWIIVLSADENAQEVEFPQDTAPFGFMPPPLR